MVGAMAVSVLAITWPSTLPAKGGLAMASAAAKQGSEKDEKAKAALGVLESAKAVNEGKAAKLTAAAPAEPLLQFVSKMIK